MFGKALLAAAVALVLAAAGGPAAAQEPEFVLPLEATLPEMTDWLEPARSRDRALWTGRQAMESLAMLRAAGEGGVTPAYVAAFQAYEEDHFEFVYAVNAAVNAGPAVVRSEDEWLQAYRRHRELKEDPNATPQALAEAAAAEAKALETRERSGPEAIAALTAALGEEGVWLPDPASRLLWAKGQTEPLPPTPFPRPPASEARTVFRLTWFAGAATISQDAMRAEGRRGYTGSYLARRFAYWNDWKDAISQAEAMVEETAEVRALKAASDKARSELQIAETLPLASPTEVALAVARNEAAYRAYEKGLRAAALYRLETMGYYLPDPESRELWAQGQIRHWPVWPVPPAIFGLTSNLFPDAPWQIELQWADVDDRRPPFEPEQLHACGGALIRPDWVLTAAHCVWDKAAGKPMPAAKLRVRAGGIYLSDPMPRFAIDRIYVPGGPRRYLPSTRTAPPQNDLALLHIAPRAKVAGAIATIGLAPPGFVPPTQPQMMTASGWGATNSRTYHEQLIATGRQTMSPELRVGELNPIANPDCSRQLRERVRKIFPGAPVEELPPSALCAGSDQTGTCTGDSGGPLVAQRAGPAGRPVLVGLVSWGAGCQGFSVFTRVSAFNDWIVATIAAHERQFGRR